MSDLPRTRRPDREGFLFALTLDNGRLRLRLLGVFTIGWVRLDTIRYIRQRGGWELLQLFRDSFRHPFRSWYWPRLGLARGVHHSAPFMICTQTGRRIYVRLRPGFHHRLRAAVGAARWAGKEENQGDLA